MSAHQSQDEHASRYIKVNGLQLHYLDYGRADKTTMLCVHGGAAHAHWFDSVAPLLNDGYHVMALDLRGHGDSDWASVEHYTHQDYVDDIAQVIETLNLRDVVLVGHSMGGIMSLLYAATHPGHISNLIIVDSRFNTDESRIGAMKSIGTKSGSSYATRDEFVNRYRLRPPATVATPEVMHNLALNSGRCFDDGRWRNKFDRNIYAQAKAFDAAPYWNDIHIPALLMRCEHSERVGDDVCADVKTRCPQIEIAEIAGSDHHVTLDQPQAFAATLRSFLNRHA